MSNLSPTSLHAGNDSSMEYASSSSSRPCLQLEPAVVETVVTHTTRTTTTFAPIALPRIPPPDHLDLPSHLSVDAYPLAREPIPDDLRVFTLDLDGRRVVVQEDGTSIPTAGVPGVSHGPGWVRSGRRFKRDDERMDLLQAFSAKGKEVRKRPHVAKADRQTPPPASRQPDRPRKKIRQIGDVTISDGGYMSPLPSPEQEERPTASVGSGLEVAALFSLPAIVDQFDKFPDQLQQHVLMHLLRRSRVPTVQRILALTGNALRRDFVGLLPHEIALQILGYVDAKSLAAAALVNRKWYGMINDERSVWKDRLVADDLFYGLGTEETEEAVIERRYEALDLRPHDKPATPVDDDESMLDDDEGHLPYRPAPLKHVYRRRFQNSRNWLRGAPHHISFAGHGTNVVTCLQFDEDKIVSASDDHSVNVYSTRTGHLRKRLDGHEGGVWALEYKGDTLVTGSTDRSVRVWDLESMTQAHVFHGHSSTVRCLQIVEPVYDEATGEYQPPYPLIVTGSRDATLRVWKLPKKGEEPYMPPTDEENTVPPEHNPYHVHLLAGHTQAVRALAAHGRYCVSGSYDNEVRHWDMVKGTCLHVLRGHEQKVYSIAYDALRNRCVSGSMDNTVKIWDLATGTCMQTLQGHTSLVGLLGISPNHIVSAAADASLRIWNANTHELEHILASHGGAITCFQHDETKVVSGSDGSLKLWDIRTGECVGDLVVGISSVWQVVFKDNLLIAASNRNNNTFFDVFDFGRLNDPSGVDDERLDQRTRPPWERDNPREPQTYQLDDAELVSPTLEPRRGRQRARGSKRARHHLLRTIAVDAASPTPSGSHYREAGPSSSFGPTFDGEDEPIETEAGLDSADEYPLLDSDES